MKDTGSGEKQSALTDAGRVFAPDGEGIVFLRGDEMQPRFGAHERRAAVVDPRCDHRDRSAEQHD